MESLLAGLTGGLVGAVLSFIISFLTLRFNYRQLFAETVSKNRMEWINVWRENIAIFLSRAQALREKEKRCGGVHRFIKSDQGDSVSLEAELYKARSMITMRLNMEEEPHILMYGALMNFDWKMKDDLDFKKQCEVVELLAREILKPEWERVKKEAKGRG